MSLGTAAMGISAPRETEREANNYDWMSEVQGTEL